MKPKNNPEAQEKELQNNVENDKGQVKNEDLPENKSEITMDALSENESFPEVKENAINAVNEQKQAEKIEAQNLELQGIKLKKDGTPAKKRGRKSGAEKSEFVIPQGNTPPPVSPSLEAGMLTSALIEQMTITLISEDFRLEQHERENNVMAWVKAYDYYGGVEVKPPMALLMSHASIILARAHKEKTQTKIGLVKAWVKNKIANMKSKNKGGNNAQSNSRPDNVGENDIRKEESAKP